MLNSSLATIATYIIYTYSNNTHTYYIYIQYVYILFIKYTYFKEKFDLDERVKEVIRFKTNDQLNQFSSMYFNKIKKDLIIYGL